MKFYLPIILSFCSVAGFSQEKKRFINNDQILINLQPSKMITSWAVHKNDNGSDVVLKKVGSTPDYTSSKGFWNDAGTFYYIVYNDKSGMHTITQPDEFTSFISIPKSGYEAAFIAGTHGYFADEEYKDIAGNFADDKGKYALELGKITSEKCPFRKTEYVVMMDKSTGKILSEKEGKTYMEVYLKDCANNPRNLPTKPKKIYLEDTKKVK